MDLLPVEPGGAGDGTLSQDIVGTKIPACSLPQLLGIQLLTPWESPMIRVSLGMLMRCPVAEGSCIASVRGLVVRATDPNGQTGTSHLC